VFAAADAGGHLSGAALLAHRISASLTVGAVLLVLALVIAVAVRPRSAVTERAPTTTPASATGVAAPEAEEALIKR
jgi:hypothetical protein